MAQQAKIIKADYKLRAKTGAGEIAAVTVEKAERVIESNEVDFREVAKETLTKLDVALRVIESSEFPVSSSVLDDVTAAVMQLKANGRMFKYTLVSDLASVMLGFLEQIETLDRDAFTIVKAHQNTLSVIISKGMHGTGGALGTQLVKELENACDRYYRRNPGNFKPSNP